MKKRVIYLIISTLFCFSFLQGCKNTEKVAEKETIENTVEVQKTEEQTSDKLSEIHEKNTVVILATGGTIAGIGEQGKETGYTPGTLSVESLIEAVPDLKDVANIEAVQVCNVNSDDMTMEIWLTLAEKINAMAQDSNVSGFVVTHGTDTMEETAYFLNLVAKTSKPIVLTGSMRPSTSTSADGPMNLYQAVCVADSKEAMNKGVLIVFSDKIFSARSVKKMSTYDVTAISAGEFGNIGIVRNKDVFFYETPSKKHTIESEFDVKDIKFSPKVSIAYFSVDADPDFVQYMADRSDALVIAGAGAGEFSKDYIDVINKINIPIAISSRIDDGIITQDTVLCKNTVAADNLSPQKAAVLLKLALIKTTNQQELIRIFSEY